MTSLIKGESKNYQSNTVSCTNKKEKTSQNDQRSLFKNKLKETSDTRLNRTYTFGADLIREKERRNSLTADSDIFDYNIDDLVRGIKPRHPSRSASKSLCSKNKICSTLYYPIAVTSSKYKNNTANTSETLSICEDKWRSNLPSVKGFTNTNLCGHKLYSRAKFDLNKYEKSLNHKHNDR
ncbi:Hypothetical protein SRAE_0000042400 [Strongyloides ratti]|uniref:Uncharacterized protein n=1 Tax=Strongyloides ratti TaxID=34506 RepID=A0A090MSP0_STRRB|nr:Hypothetical protein SRAE_0000042400 [Strongyloides ratti]CEF61298.1 Hypothetical protein SRAE_0000042400 [Strongyloides ratti]